MRTYTKEFREKAVADCLASGMSQRQFADKIGVCLSTLKWWIHNRPNCGPAEFVDLAAAAGEGPGAETAPKPSIGRRIEVAINGATVAGDPAAIAEILRGMGR